MPSTLNQTHPNKFAACTWDWSWPRCAAFPEWRGTVLSLMALLLLASAAAAQTPAPGSRRPPLVRVAERIGPAGLQQESLPPPVATSFQPWWDVSVHAPLRDAPSTVEVSLESLLIAALDNSPQVRVFSDLPLIRETAILEANAAFDWRAFAETRWDDFSDPVGSTLTTGGPPRYRNDYSTSSMGLRRRNAVGGQVEAAQQLGWQDTNSIFFVPNPQGTARLNLSYTQPLMRGRGKVYNTSLIVLAEIDANVAHDEFVRQLESHLLEVTRGYWGLYLERGILTQQRKNAARAAEIVATLEKRRALDALESQVAQAQAAAYVRQADLYRGELAVKNAEARLRALVGTAESDGINPPEMLPMGLPTAEFLPTDLAYARGTALQHRPEITQAIKQAKAGGIRLEMSKHEMMPVLDLVLKTYASGLQGGGSVSDAWTDQFSQGRPSYSVGLQFEVPLGNRAASARLERRKLELRQLQNQLQTTVQTLTLEVDVAVREIETAYREMGARRAAMQAIDQDVQHLDRRWRALPGDDRSSSLFLDNLLLAQDRLAAAEASFLKSQMTYNLALTNVKRAMGTLLQGEGVVASRAYDDDCRPTMILDKFPSSAQNPRYGPGEEMPASPRFPPPSANSRSTLPPPSVR